MPSLLLDNHSVLSYLLSNFLDIYFTSSPLLQSPTPFVPFYLGQWHDFRLHRGHWGWLRELPRLLSPCLSAHQHPHPLPSSLCLVCAWGEPSVPVPSLFHWMPSHWTLFQQFSLLLRCHLFFCFSNGYYQHNYMLLFLSILKTISFSLTFHSLFNPGTMLLGGVYIHTQSIF